MKNNLHATKLSIVIPQPQWGAPYRPDWLGWGWTPNVARYKGNISFIHIKYTPPYGFMIKKLPNVPQYTCQESLKLFLLSSQI